MAKTFTSSAIIYGPTLPANADGVDGALFYKTNDVGGPAGLYMFGFVSDSGAGFGSQVAQSWRSTLGTIDLGALGGLLDTASGGTGSSGPYIKGSLIWAATTTSMASTSVGTAGQVLLSGGTNVPTWTNQSSLNVNSAASATEAATLSTARTIDISGVTATATSFDGSANISIPITAIPSSLLTGTIATARLTGTYTIDINGNATSANTAGSATTAQTLLNSRTISLSGDATGSVSFNGSANVAIVTTVNDSAKLDGQARDTTNTPSTIVSRTSNGYVYAERYNMESANSENPTIGQIIVTNGTDNFLRKSSLASVVSTLGSSFLLNTTDTFTGTLTLTGSQTISNDLTVGNASGDVITVNGITLAWNGSAISTSGNITGAQGRFSEIFSGDTGGIGYTRILPGNSTRTGYVAFYDELDVRQGYVGYATNSTADNGGMSYVAGSHNFTGSILSTGNVTAYSSDGRLKTNVTIIKDAAKKVVSLGGYSYDWDTVKCLEAGFTPENQHEHGLIAQEVAKVLPDAVAAAPFNDKYLTVRYERVVALLVAAIGEQQKELEELRARLDRVEHLS